MQLRTIAPLLLTLLLTASFGVGPLPCPGPATEPPPPRRLTGAEAQRVEELLAQVSKLEKASRFADALTAYQEILAIRHRVQGADHWEAVNAHWQVETLRKLAALPAAAAAEWTEAQRLLTEADQLRRQVQLARAEALYRQVLEVRRRFLGEDQPVTAAAYGNVALALQDQGKFADAQPLFQKSLDVKRRLLGEDNPLTADGYNNVAFNLNAQARHAEAEQLYRKALAIRRRLLGEEQPPTAQSYGNLAYTLNIQGKYAEAQPLFQKALALQRQFQGKDRRPVKIALALNNLAFNLTVQGKYAEAQPLFQKSVDMYRRRLGEDHPATASSSINLAENLSRQGKYAEAEALYRKALDINRRVLGDRHPFTALAFNNLGSCLIHQDKFAEAQPLCRTALELCQQTWGEDHPHTAATLNMLGSCLTGLGRYAEAQPLFEKALDLNRRRLGESHPYTPYSAAQLARCLYDQGRYAEAETRWVAAADGFDRVRLQLALTGLERAQYYPALSPFFPLAAVLARNGKPAQAWRRLEQGLGRGLADDLSARQSRRLSPEDQKRQQELTAALQRSEKLLSSPPQGQESSPERARQLAELSRRNSVLHAQLSQLQAELIRKYPEAAGEVYDLAQIRAQLPADAALLAWLDIKGEATAADPNGEHWACVVRHQGPPAWVHLPGSGPGGKWTRQDDELPGQLAQHLGRRPVEATQGWQELAARLARQRLAPVTKLLAGDGGRPPVKRLIVLPSAQMAPVPLEALLGDDSAYTVCHAPSGTLFAWLRGQAGRASRQPLGLLALADPAFPTPQPGADRADPRPSSTERGKAYQRLPGTRREVEAIAQTFRRRDPASTVRLLLGSDASEQELARIDLSRYRYLHLATHGEADNRRALQSALILAQDHLPDPLEQALKDQPVFDGRLTAAQILHTWKLDADLVVLSACESGLGKPGGGDGYLGFAQALVLAGARSVVLSLWKVDDNATALLMQRFYQNLLGIRPGLDRPLPKAEALHEAKHWLRHLTAKEVDQHLATLPRGQVEEAPAGTVPVQGRPYAHPYYWAGFILLGDLE